MNKTKFRFNRDTRSEFFRLSVLIFITGMVWLSVFGDVSVEEIGTTYLLSLFLSAVLTLIEHLFKK